MKAEKHKDTLAAFMVTYPSTYGVFESGVEEACQIVHQSVLLFLFLFVTDEVFVKKWRSSLFGWS